MLDDPADWNDRRDAVVPCSGSGRGALRQARFALRSQALADLFIGQDLSGCAQRDQVGDHTHFLRKDGPRLTKDLREDPFVFHL